MIIRNVYGQNVYEHYEFFWFFTNFYFSYKNALTRRLRILLYSTYVYRYAYAYYSAHLPCVYHCTYIGNQRESSAGRDAELTTRVCGRGRTAFKDNLLFE